MKDANRTWKIGSNVYGAGTSKFSIFDETALANRLVIDTSGNVGIGTTGKGHLFMSIKTKAGQL